MGPGRAAWASPSLARSGVPETPQVMHHLEDPLGRSRWARWQRGPDLPRAASAAHTWNQCERGSKDEWSSRPGWSLGERLAGQRMGTQCLWSA